jgi:hypothetical protein
MSTSSSEPADPREDDPSGAPTPPETPVTPDEVDPETGTDPDILIDNPSG